MPFFASTDTFDKPVVFKGSKVLFYRSVTDLDLTGKVVYCHLRRTAQQFKNSLLGTLLGTAAICLVTQVL